MLGPVEARLPDGDPVAVGGPQVRSLLAMPALEAHLAILRAEPAATPRAGGCRPSSPASSEGRGNCASSRRCSPAHGWSP
ncbi:hypothetical protein [Nonomuraea jabiensis]|uniref:Uncharacterized protein n=1 Tax=Nonomuraea jabiensis TaxID=882448 RepID=A0A7W9LG81_9ACTN|nr:hypothetical protein [Nonomuraea jabiensis]MBB5782652.1 hypothetical protein [Nonomuraea jabiensis]